MEKPFWNKIRILEIGIPLLVLAGLTLLFLPRNRDFPEVVLRPAGPLPSFDYLNYDFPNRDLFIGDKFWIITDDTSPGARALPKENRAHFYLYDLAQEKILGESSATDRLPLIDDPDHHRQLYEWSDNNRSLKPTVFERFMSSVGLISSTALSQDRVEFWLRKGTGPAFQVAVAHEARGTGGLRKVSPQRDWIWVRSTQKESFIIDMGKDVTFELPAFKSWSGAWWSRHELLFLSDTNDLSLFNMVSRNQSTVLTRYNIEQRLAHDGFKPGELSIYPVSDGARSAIFMIGRGKDHWAYRLNPDKSMDLLSTQWPIRSIPVFDPGGTFCLSQRRDSSGNISNCVFDASTQTTRALGSSFPSSGYMAMPFLYKQRIVYSRGISLWEINQDGTGNRQLFPPVPATSPPKPQPNQ